MVKECHRFHSQFSSNFNQITQALFASDTAITQTISVNNVDLVIFACLNFRDFRFWDFSLSVEFANFHFRSVALLE